MFYETMTMGIIALVIGAFLGTFFSKGFILIFKAYRCREYYKNYIFN